MTGLFVTLYGIKQEAPNVVIPLAHSQADRRKKPFKSVPITVMNSDVTRLTIGRLHFSETTANNQRKKGRPNPDQRYFQLVVNLSAMATDGKMYPLVSHQSEKLIVRASNPGLFDEHQQQTALPAVSNPLEIAATMAGGWLKGKSPDSTFHNGSVGIRHNMPDEALCVNGNVKVTGLILQPSDMRVKTDVAPLDQQQQLRNIRDLKLYKYNLTKSWCEHTGRKETTDYGVLAQELQQILPEAVTETRAPINLADGSTIHGLLTVNKERVFLENIGAVQAIAELQDQMQSTIKKLERQNTSLRMAMRRSSSILELQKNLDLLDLQDEDQSANPVAATAVVAPPAARSNYVSSTVMMLVFFLALLTAIAAA